MQMQAQEEVSLPLDRHCRWTEDMAKVLGVPYLPRYYTPDQLRAMNDRKGSGERQYFRLCDDPNSKQLRKAKEILAANPHISQTDLIKQAQVSFDTVKSWQAHGFITLSYTPSKVTRRLSKPQKPSVEGKESLENFFN